jgi:hypothetical protein
MPTRHATLLCAAELRRARGAPQAFKLCGRCRGAAYCCAAHSKEDWARHKREDGCAAPR